MRTVHIPTGTHRSTRRNVTLVLRAADRRGDRCWEGHNVARDLRDYIRRHLHEEIDGNAVSYAMRWLTEQGYAYRQMSGGGRATVAFTIAEDVNLTLVAATERAVTNGTAPEDGWQGYRKAPSLPRNEQPPLPLHDHTYRLDELTQALRSWAKHDREAYATWVDQVLSQLQEG